MDTNLPAFAERNFMSSIAYIIHRVLDYLECRTYFYVVHLSMNTKLIALNVKLTEVQVIFEFKRGSL